MIVIHITWVFYFKGHSEIGWFSFVYLIENYIQ